MEDEFDKTGSILATEVRKQEGALLENGFGKYKKFERLGDRNQKIEKFLNLRSVKVNGSGRRVQWVSKA